LCKRCSRRGCCAVRFESMLELEKISLSPSFSLSLSLIHTHTHTHIRYTYQCTENKCSALQLESLGLTGLGSTSACQNQQQLSTHTNPSCQVTCMQGYESSTSNATYTCDSNSANGDSAQISPAITCAENICRVKLSAGMAAAPVSELCAECVNGLSLFTHSQPNCCNVKVCPFFFLFFYLYIESHNSSSSSSYSATADITHPQLNQPRR